MLDELHLCAFATAWLQMSPEFIALSHTPKLPHWNTNTGSGVPSKQSTTQRIQDPCISLPKQFITGPFLSGSLIHSKYLSVQLLTQFNTDPLLSGSLLHSKYLNVQLLTQSMKGPVLDFDCTKDQPRGLGHRRPSTYKATNALPLISAMSPFSNAVLYCDSITQVLWCGSLTLTLMRFDMGFVVCVSTRFKQPSLWSCNPVCLKHCESVNELRSAVAYVRILGEPFCFVLGSKGWLCYKEIKKRQITWIIELLAYAIHFMLANWHAGSFALR